jgi:hypothetical protein
VGLYRLTNSSGPSDARLQFLKGLKPNREKVLTSSTSFRPQLARSNNNLMLTAEDRAESVARSLMVINSLPGSVDTQPTVDVAENPLGVGNPKDDNKTME